MDLTIKTEIKTENEEPRKDPTLFLPEEPMSYEFRKKKKKKKKKEDPFKDLDAMDQVKLPVIITIDPEVNIKAEDIEVELDFNDFVDNSNPMDDYNENSQELEIKIEPQNHDATLLTFESVIKEKVEMKTEDCDEYDDNVPLDQFPSAPICDEFDDNVPLDQLPIAPSHVCKVCHLVFQSPKTLRMHQRRKHKVFRKSFKHICDHCGMAYKVKNSLLAHIRRKHGPNTLEDDREEKTCDICALVFKGITRLRMHMRRKHGSFEESFKHVCEDCGLTYDKYQSLIVHIKRKHSPFKKPEISQLYRCVFCPKVFIKRETFARHVQRKHHVSEDTTKQEKHIEDYLKSCKNEETGEITCKECPLVFSSINYLKLHMRRKHNALQEDFSLKCSICNLSYIKIESLKRHVRRKHDNGSFCEVCYKQFATRELYLNHSHKKFVNECSICGLIFASPGGLSKHIRCTHKILTPKTVFCDVCNAGFHDKRQLKPHMMKVHLKVSYTCKYCTKVFRNKESYRRHVMYKHPTPNNFKSPPQKCDQCTETFQDEFELCNHVKSVHHQENQLDKNVIKTEEDIKNIFQCTKCPESYLIFEQLRTHYEKNHHEIQCQICGEIIPGLELQKHIKNHHMEKDMKCRYCDFKTNVKVSLTQHMLRHKNATTLHCDFADCKYKSFYEGAMERHKKKHADLGVKLQCTQCPFQTMNKYILRYHEEAHETGKKRYMCDQCDYATILPANLVQHRYKHSNEKKFKCEVCPFATKYNTSLRFHVKTKHCDLPTFT